MGTIRRILSADRERFKTRRRRQLHIELDLAVAYMGEDFVIAIMKAVKDDSETPLTQLPASAWRDEIIAKFRERHAGRKTAEIVRLK